jgi:hypothetical protein
MYQEQGEGGEEGAKPKKKSDPWLTGCLGLVIIAFLAIGFYVFIYKPFIEKPSPAPQLPPSSGNETGLKPMQSPEFEALQDMGTVALLDLDKMHAEIAEL